MEYLVTEARRKASRSTCYIEFQKGQYHGCRQEDSVSLHDDLWTQNHLSVLFGRVLPDFDFYGITTVNAAQWEELLGLVRECEPGQGAILAELAPWVEDCFRKHEVFTIIGMQRMAASPICYSLSLACGGDFADAAGAFGTAVFAGGLLFIKSSSLDFSRLLCWV